MYTNCGQLHLEENGLFDFDLHVMIANVYWKPDLTAFEKFFINETVQNGFL